MADPERAPDASPDAAGAADPGAPAKPPVEAPQRTPAFRRALLAKLSHLGYAVWAVKDSFRLDEEWNSIVNVRADAILEPLERVAPERV
jgi:hypothetical protein